MCIFKDPPPGMCLIPDTDDLTKVSQQFFQSIIFVLHEQSSMAGLSFILHRTLM